MPGQELNPALVQVIENNLLLHQVLEDLKEIKATQQANHILVLTLRDHKTIERVDRIWTTALNLRWALGGLGAVLAGLYATHSIWHWPI